VERLVDQHDVGDLRIALGRAAELARADEHGVAPDPREGEDAR
jgi:hypothetical protein